MEITDVRRSIAKHTDRHIVILCILIPYSKTGGNWQMTAHDGMPAPHIPLNTGHVHGTALTSGHPGRFSHQFGHHFVRWNSSIDGHAMIAISRDDTVPRLTRCDQPRRDS